MIPNSNPNLAAMFWEAGANDFTLVPVIAFSSEGLPMVLNSLTARLEAACTLPGFDSIDDGSCSGLTRSMF